MKKLLLLFAVLATAISTFAENYILYTTSDGKIVKNSEMYWGRESPFGANIVSNTYEDGQGKLVFDGEVTKIGRCAFGYYCHNLATIKIPNSVTSIGSDAFFECGLTELELPNSVKEIGDRAFYYNPYLQSVTIPESVEKIDGDIFGGCKRLTEFNGKYASEDHRCLIDNGLLLAFAPAGLEQYTIPNNVTEIGEYVFCGLTLKSYTIPNSVKKIGKFAFSDNMINLTEITIPNSVTEIDKGAFEDCKSLEKISIPNTVTRIGENAFYGCQKLKTIKLPDILTEIEDELLWECSSLTVIDIPASVKTIYGRPFWYCTGLNAVYVHAANPSEIAIKRGEFTFDYELPFDQNAFNNATLYVPQGSKSLYETAAVWKNFIRIEEYDPTSINTIVYTKKDAKSYNMQGAEVGDGYKGIVIQDGRKVMRK